ncbi:MAG: hypothetical protein WCX28_12330 [Bacteriovoracaceae bacterium]|nr:hypothetical protein [Bacteroidota bacterium]
MTTEATASKGGLEWKWIITGIIAGTALCLSLYLMIAKTFHIPLIPTYMSLLGLVVMGIIIGYKSDGYTVKEPAIGGIFTLALTGIVLSNTFGFTFTTMEMIGAPIIGLILGLVGGWVGEQIQITPEELVKELEDDKKGGLQWGWIIAGTVIAFIFNAFFVIGGFALLKFGVGGIILALGASFLFAGLLVGYFSPGVTIMEAGIAGGLSVILNAVFLYSFSLLMAEESVYVLEGLAVGFVLSLVGGWLGEKLQSFMENDNEHEK